eukprot:331230-Heterocapsa_arctica.AAC.1
MPGWEAAWFPSPSDLDQNSIWYLFAARGIVALDFKELAAKCTRQRSREQTELQASAIAIED